MQWELGGKPHHQILTPEALDFVAALHAEFDGRRRALLEQRHQRQLRLDAGEDPAFPDSVARRTDWTVATPPADLADRRTEITGPVDKKMMINALNSGASTFMADFEDATTPTWANLIEGQANLVEAYRGTLSFDSGEREYRVGDEPGTLMVRPRGWHLPERHLLIDGEPASAALFDFGLYLFHGGRAALEHDTGPYLYLPKLESHLEARLWNDVFCFAQDRLGIPRGTIRATVLIETVLAAFEMDEILHELADHSAGLNAGRWDYIFSMIKKFRHRPSFLLPDRSQVTMTVPFMRAYTELLVATCHRRGAHAIGGMSAFIPNRRRPDVTQIALAKVGDDKRRESTDGFDGTWVAHPDLVSVARAEFDRVLGERPHQIERLRPEVAPVASDLLETEVVGGTITPEGVRTDVDVGIRYLASWLNGTGAAAINDLMEDVATAEICRSQIWQWVHNRGVTTEGQLVTRDLVERLAAETFSELGPSAAPAAALFTQVALEEPFIEFLTIPAYQLID